jgi:RecA/RadA recombinase
MAFSQGLTPKITVEKGDTLFSFTIPQSKMIAGFIQREELQDSLLNNYVSQQENMTELLEIKDSLLTLEKKEIIEKDSMIALLQREKLQLENQFLENQKELALQKKESTRMEKQHRLQRGGLGLVIVVLSVLGLLK